MKLEHPKEWVTYVIPFRSKTDFSAEWVAVVCKVPVTDTFGGTTYNQVTVTTVPRTTT